MCYMCDDPVPSVIPGDPDTVSRFATAFANTADALRDAARELRNLANENITISLAVDEVRGKADEVASDTGKVAERYQGAGDTFSSYASALASARSTGNGARANIISNNEDARYWRHRERDLREQVAYGSTDADVLQDLQDAARRAAHYDGLFTTYIGRYGSAVEDRDQAVTAAINGLADAEEASGLNDGFWDGILGDLQQLWELISKYLGPVLEVLKDALEIIKQIVDIISLIVSILAIFLPVLGPLALALVALSAILAIAIFACSALLFLMGRESLGTLISDGINMVVSVVTARFAGAASLFGAVRGGAATFAQIGAKIANPASVTIVVNTTAAALGPAAAEFVGDGVVGGSLSAAGTIFSFVGESNVDLQLGQSSPPWGAPSGGGDASSILPGVMDGATLGMASPTVNLVNIVTEGISLDLHSDEFASSWGSIGVVPAT
jgi:hypothetical protein